MKNYKKSQQGATLIVVMVLLVIITIMGTLAIRQGITTLSIATNSQAQSLLVQNSDSGLFNIEDRTQLGRYRATTGMLGYLILPENRNKEVAFCYRGRSTDFFDVNNYSVMYWESGTSPNNNELGMDGYCNPANTGNNSDFISGRNAVITQINVSMTKGTLDAFSGMAEGTEAGGTAKVPPAEIYVVYATSAVPGLSSATNAQIYECFSQHLSNVTVPAGVTPATNADDSITDCLARLNVPYSTQVAEYRYENL